MNNQQQPTMNNQQQTTKAQTVLQSSTATVYPELNDMQLEVVAGGKGRGIIR
ncbi:hypothetical protein [Nostoc sp.]|uniref:hypothetical protein n=1 Tax=Nostoc sp. TaxID=1180 RepID=UPI002FFA6861